jgi:hypothetical protein
MVARLRPSRMKKLGYQGILIELNVSSGGKDVRQTRSIPDGRDGRRTENPDKMMVSRCVEGFRAVRRQEPETAPLQQTADATNRPANRPVLLQEFSLARLFVLGGPVFLKLAHFLFFFLLFLCNFFLSLLKRIIRFCQFVPPCRTLLSYALITAFSLPDCTQIFNRLYGGQRPRHPILGRGCGHRRRHQA